MTTKNISASKSWEKKLYPVQILKFCRVLIPHIGLIAALWMVWQQRLHLIQYLPLYVLTPLTGIGFTVGYHRLFAHRSFEAKKPVKTTLAILGLMGSHLTITEYAAVHRCHHAFSDRSGDPHSPHLSEGEGLLKMTKGLWHSYLGWLFDRDLNLKDKIDKYASDLTEDSVIVTLDRLHYLWILLGILIPTLLGFALTQSWNGALIGFVWWGLLRMFIQDQIEFGIRSFSHYWGDRSFKTKDFSTNNWIAIISLGEWHNNHHAFPHAANQGLEPWQYDLSYKIILTLEKLGLASNIKRVSPQEIELKKLALNSS
ncbi:MAG: fatty acid desaturase [Prochloraceae cyanobacterium]|nr:fatty acid desaturase [Prochloraceae cyanobacterium]